MFFNAQTSCSGQLSSLPSVKKKQNPSGILCFGAELTGGISDLFGLVLLFSSILYSFSYPYSGFSTFILEAVALSPWFSSQSPR